MSKTAPTLPTVADDAVRTAIGRGNTEAQWGPCMRALTERQQAFVVYLLETGSANYTRAAAFAGYSCENYDSLRVTAHRLAHDAKVQAAMREESERRLRGAAILATSRLIEIANSPGHKDQVRALGMILDRVGLPATSEQTINVKHETVSDQEMVSKIVALCQEMKLDPRQMLGKVDGLVIDAEYQVINPPVPVRQIEAERSGDAAGTTAGLEDLL